MVADEPAEYDVTRTRKIIYLRNAFQLSASFLTPPVPITSALHC
jgi:hypothetical protein